MTQALADMVVDPDAIGAFVEPMGYADYAPTKADAILGPAESPGASFPPATCSNGSIVDTGTIGVRQWYMDSIGAAQAWANSAAGSPRGAGVKTIVADTGVGAHEDFLGGGRDLTRARNLLLPLTTDGLTDNDPHGHGTSVGGLIAAQANNGGIIGVAPDSQVVPFRVIYRNGSTIGFSVARALTVAMATQGRDPSVRIINLSLAEPIFATNMAGGLIASLGTLNPSWMIPAMATYLTEVELAKRAARRLLVVASAGNTGGTFLEFYGSTFPATVDGVLSVGALDTDGRAKLFSSTSPWGTTPDPTVAIAAPGNSLAAPETGMYSGRLTDLTCFGGTSGAAPIAAAGGAVLMSIPSRAFTPSQVRGHLVSSAIPTGDSVGLVGAGAMNLESAVNHAIAAPGRYVTIGGRATGTPLADTTFAGTAFALLGGGTSIAAEPTSGATHYLPIGVSGGPYSWIVGDPTSSSSTSTLFAGAIGATSVSSIVVSGGVATVAAIPLPAAAVAKPVIVLANAPEMRRWLLVPVATGLVSVALHDGSLTATTLVSNLTAAGQIAASIGFLGSTTNIRVALVDTSGTDSSVLKLYAFDVVKNTIVHEQDSVVLPFSPTRLAVPGVAMGSFASTPLDQDEFPVVMLGGAGQLARTFRTHSSTTAPISNHTLFGLSYEGIVPSPLRPEMYAYTDDGVVVGFDPLSFVARFQENISTGVSLGALSVSPDGNSLFFANAFAVFNPNDPQAPPTYDSMWIFNP